MRLFREDEEMSLGLSFFIGLAGPELSKEERRWLTQYGAAGVILYKRNIQSFAQLRELQKQVQQCAVNGKTEQPVLFAIDLEGGSVAELPSHSFRVFPSPLDYLKSNPHQTLYEFGLDQGTYLRQLGFHINFAPCLDVCTLSSNTLIRDRVLGVTLGEICERARHLIRGYHDSGIMVTAKHFPGHGSTETDSHFALPIDSRSWDDIVRESLPPFRVAQELGVDFLMTAHVLYPKVDRSLPATLSYEILTQKARRELGIWSFILADDLDMGALKDFGGPLERSLKFIAAGGDFLMFAHRSSPPFEELEFLQSHISLEDYRRLKVLQSSLLLKKVLLANEMPFP
ncbi:MAG: glycoside hydrolase family 3 N-terminal domain-containing protein [Pseudobdellovibrionaceae bacterium]|nr:glycoside hydrolase family 3 N-terminal domain-containing protein [Pseudobdellovibrionaceae bacterium]